MSFKFNPVIKFETHAVFWLVFCLFLTAVPTLANSTHKTHTVAIEGMKFTPDVLEIEAGDAVVWTNKDIFPHVVYDEKNFKSKTLLELKSFSFKYKRVGTFPYICALHPTMKALVVVKPLLK